MATTPAKTQRRPRTAKRAAPQIWKVRLYVAGQTPKSALAIANLTALCDQHLKNRYRIEVVDLLEHPEMARGDQIVAVPTLVVKLPKLVRKIIGDLSNTDRALIGLALQPEGE